MCMPSRCVLGANCINGFNRELFGAMSISPFGPFFVVPISHVVCVCTEKQVIRSDALRIVAMMENLHFCGNRANMEHPAIAMRVISGLGCMKFSMPKRRATSCPLPTFTCLVDLFPKALFSWSTCRHGHVPLCWAGRCSKHLPAFYSVPIRASTIIRLMSLR